MVWNNTQLSKMALSIVSDSSVLTEVLDFRGTLLRRAFNLLDTLHTDVDDVLKDLGMEGQPPRAQQPDREREPSVRASTSTASSTGLQSALAVYSDAASLMPDAAGSLAAVETRTVATRRALDLLNTFQAELDHLITQQGLETYANAGTMQGAATMQLLGLHTEPQSSRTLDVELVRTAAATTSAAARFRTQAAETAQGALKAYVDAVAQV